jgi:CRISPR-associated protein Csd2
MTTANNVLQNRYDFVYLFDVTSGNPNGDPDAGNQPRIDPETGEGLVTDVCLKRKVRNFVTIAKRPNGVPEAGYDIYVKERGILANEQRRAYLEHPERLKAGDRPNEKAREWMCKTFYDIRAFGAVMTTGKIEDEDRKKYKDAIDPKVKKPQWNCGQVRGPIQLTFARSVRPILALEHAITRVALTNASDIKREAGEGGDDEKAASGQFGRKSTVPYALYRAHGFISPHLAAQTGFTEAGLQLFWRALCQMFEHDHSATRGQMSARGLFVFKHDSPLGNAPSHVLFDRIRVAPRGGVRVPRAFGDFLVGGFDGQNLPTGLTPLKFDCDTIADPAHYITIPAPSVT